MSPTPTMLSCNMTGKVLPGGRSAGAKVTLRVVLTGTAKVESKSVESFLTARDMGHNYNGLRASFPVNPLFLPVMVVCVRKMVGSRRSGGGAGGGERRKRKQKEEKREVGIEG